MQWREASSFDLAVQTLQFLVVIYLQWTVFHAILILKLMKCVNYVQKYIQ